MNNVEDFYPLSPMQQGMLFHSLSTPDSGMYHDQVCFSLQGQLDVAAFSGAWHRVVERHPVLRTVFLWEDLKEPIQVVHKKVQPPLTQQDWRGVSPAEQDERLNRFLRDDRVHPFTLTQAPLIRLALIRTDENVYRFIWSYHHLLLDGWSGPLVLKEVFTLYEAFCQGRDLHLAQRRPYKDYIKWLKQQDLSEAEHFWRESLQGFNAPTPLRVDRTPAKPADARIRYGSESISLGAPATQALQAFARRHHITLNTLVQAAWALLLSRYSGENDIVFGATVSGRPTALEGVESMIGVFINTLPLRAQIAPETSVTRWLTEIQSRFVELRRFEHTPLLQVQQWSEVPRGLFESLLVFENIPTNGLLHEPNASLTIGDGQYYARTNYPLTLMAVPGPELSLQITYNSERFESGTIKRMLGHLETLLHGMALEPERRLSDVPMLPEAEKHQLLVDWNDTRRDYPTDTCIHEIFEAQVERTPDAVAVAFEDKQLTYRELNQRANHLAHYLRKLGVGPDVLVGICVERSVEMVVGLLGIMKAGGAYVPLDPAFPKERLAFMLEDAQAKAVVTQRKLLRDLPEHGARTICLNSDWSAIARESKENPACDATPQSRAYVIYTSGSTGKPKGVEIAHGSVVNFLRSMRERPGMTQRDVLLAVTTISFDIAGLELYLPLTAGGCVVIASREVVVDGARLSQHITDSQATVMQATPATWRMLIDAGWQGSKGLKILCGGEALPGELAKQLLERGESLWNLYGPTETTIWSTVYRVESTDGAVPIGRPIANTEVYILDHHLHPVPIGVSGELHIGGAGLARGYLNRPELTDEKFIDHPFDHGSNARLYKTGDLARYLPDGNIEYLNRIDNQVKIRGFRIELGEIEAVLSRHPAVKEIVVVAREDVPGQRRLVAYVVPAKEPHPATSELRGYLQHKLPEYMVPSTFVILDAFPLSPNGKIDRRALPAPSQEKVIDNRNYVPPNETVEHQLVQIWEELLSVRPIGIRDNFFALGGHSLLAVRMVHRVEQVCGEKIPLNTLLSGPTIEQMTKAMVKRRIEEEPSLLVEVQKGGNEIPFFFLHGDFRGGGFYCLDLARGLGEERPFYALTPFGLDGRREPSTVEEMAASFIEMIRVVRPHGPYVLGGLCNGGLVAFEMARQLHEQREKVDLVVLLGARSWNSPIMRYCQCLIFTTSRLLRLGPERETNLFLVFRHGVMRVCQCYRHAVKQLKEGLRLPKRERVLWVLREAKTIAGIMLRRVLACGSNKNGSRSDEAAMADMHHQSEADIFYDTVLARYVPGHYSGRAVLIWPEEIPTNYPGEAPLTWDDMRDRTMGWRGFADNIEAYKVPGGWTTSLTRYVDILANRMKDSMEKTQSRKRESAGILESSFRPADYVG